SPRIKGFEIEGEKCSGKIILSGKGEFSFEKDASASEEKKETSGKNNNPSESDARVSGTSVVREREAQYGNVESVTCPQCGQGRLLQGKTAFGCSRWREGCRFKVNFEEIQAVFPGSALNLSLLQRFLNKQ
ncbi:MAG: hypothetical protein Q8859_13005, partial [Bacteroidota bacterium]|nr:hypothetical protein [Bacteroidota bacterium]